MAFPYPAERLAPVSSRTYLDRNGLDLRVTAAEGGERLVWCAADSMGAWIGPAVVAIEDRRFAWHPGIDPIGIARAAWSNIVHGEIRGGGSTITQQLARILAPSQSGRWQRKMAEAWDAWRIERALTKKEILAQYLNRASFGNRAIGIARASEVYFGKTPEMLTASEAAYLAGLLQSPTKLAFRHDLALARRDAVLRRMALDEKVLRRALSETVAVVGSPSPFHAPHYIVMLEEAGGESSIVKTTLDLRLQQEIEGLVTNHLERLKEKHVSQAAAVVLDARDGSILAWVGSAAFEISQVDGVRALRQPGSTLKPFTYALAFESGKRPSDLIDDVPFDDGTEGFQPTNFDRSYHGAVRMREALACSYNIPAARVLKEIVGVERLLDFLRRVGMTCLNREAAHYGIALTLGAGEVRLIDLAGAYAMLARGGVAMRSNERLLSPEVAALITSILSDRNARAPAFGSGGPLTFPFAVAAKTGTSKDYRDNWAVGYTPRHVVAVWVGNFDGSPMIDCSGVTGAAPLMHDIMARVGADDGEFELPSSLARVDICPKSGAAAGEECPGRITELFVTGLLPEPLCRVHSGNEPSEIGTDGFRPL